MSGYLEHVLARASGRGPALRSRPRSRFEPAPIGLPGQAVPPEFPDAVLPATAGPADRPGRSTERSRIAL